MMAREPATAQGTRALAHFDHALDASLVVSYLALRQGDAVGLYATGGDERWVAPQRSLGAIDTLLRASYDLQPQPVATDRSEEHTSELQSLMRISYAVFCLKKKNNNYTTIHTQRTSSRNI